MPFGRCRIVQQGGVTWRAHRTEGWFSQSFFSETAPLMPAVSLRRALQSPLLPFRRCAFTGKLRWRLVIEYSLVVT